MEARAAGYKKGEAGKPYPFHGYVFRILDGDNPSLEGMLPKDFASAEGKSGSQFYTPSRVVRVLVEMLAHYEGRVYDSCCGSGRMSVSSEKFIEAHSGKIGDISIYGQKSNYTT